MKHFDETIGVRGLSAVLLLTVGLKLTDMTPSMFLLPGLSAGWIVVIVSAAVMVLPIYVTTYLVKKYDAGLIEVIYKTTGSWFGLPLAFGLWLVAIGAVSIDVRSYAELVNTMYYPQTPMWVFHLLIFVSSILAYWGIENIVRTAWILLPYIQAALFILVVLAFLAELNWSYILPLLGTGVPRIMKAGAANAGIFGELVMVGVMYSYLKNSKEYAKGLLIGGGISFLQLVLFTFLYVAVFDYMPASTLMYPYHQLTRSVGLGRFFTNIEAFFLIFWIMSSIIRFAFYIYITILIFVHTFHLKEYKPLVLPITMLAYSMGTFQKNAAETTFVYRQHLLQFATVYLFVLPLLLWVISMVRKRGITS